MVVKKIIEIGGEELIQLENNSEATSLHYACAYDASSDVVQKILESIPESVVLKKDKDKWTTPLHYACAQNATANVIRFLIENAGGLAKRRALVERQTDKGWTAVHLACRACVNADIVKLLLDNSGSDFVSQVNEDRWTALHHACANAASADVVQLLLNIGKEELAVAKMQRDTLLSITPVSFVKIPTLSSYN